MHEYLKKAAHEYYNGTPFLTDPEFDYLAKVNNFNQLGSAPLREGTVPHPNRLYSLDKFYENDKLPFKSSAAVRTPKLDGSAISLVYLNGIFYSAATRGDGFIGEDVTENFKAWDAIPKTIDKDEGIVQIVGEICAPSSVENSRNYASGATRLKSPEEFVTRDIYFITYALLHSGELLEWYEMDLALLREWGFSTVDEETIWQVFPTDGVVYRLRNNQSYIDAGFTSKHPKGAFALKDSDQFEVKETELLDVVWQVGKSGKVTPVAIFETIVLEDASINRATLNNAGFIEDMDLYLGDTILVTRAGGIIPKVLGKKDT